MHVRRLDIRAFAMLAANHSSNSTANGPIADCAVPVHDTGLSGDTEGPGETTMTMGRHLCPAVGT